VRVGSLSLWIAEKFPKCLVLAVSNSVPQGEFIRARARELSLGNVEVTTADMNGLTRTVGSTASSPWRCSSTCELGKIA